MKTKGTMPHPGTIDWLLHRYRVSVENAERTQDYPFGDPRRLYPKPCGMYASVVTQTAYLVCGGDHELADALDNAIRGIVYCDDTGRWWRVPDEVEAYFVDGYAPVRPWTYIYDLGEDTLDITLTPYKSRFDDDKTKITYRVEYSE